MDLMRQRRNLLKTAALGLGTLAFPSLQTAFAKKPPARKLKIGHACITWARPRARETMPLWNRR